LPAQVEPRIDVKVGFACNNHCKFCVQGNKREKFGRKSFQRLANILKLNAAKRPGVVFTGGEPTLHPDLVELVRMASALGYSSIQIQSNGRMFSYAGYCEQLVRAGATEFSPALHGHDPNSHDYHTSVSGSFEQTVQGIKNLKSMGQRVITNTVITRSNFRLLPNIAQLLVELKVDQFQLAFVHPVGSAGPEMNFASIVPRFQLLEPYLHKALEIGLNAGCVVMTEAVPFCFMKGYEELVGEKIMPKTKIFDAEGIIEDYEEYRLAQGKAKGEVCQGCKANSFCEGPWREYTERYGWEEFKALT